MKQDTIRQGAQGNSRQMYILGKSRQMYLRTSHLASRSADGVINKDANTQ